MAGGDVEGGMETRRAASGSSGKAGKAGKAGKGGKGGGGGAGLLEGVETGELVRELLVRIGEDPDRQGLLRTPERVADSLMWLTRGYRQSVDEMVGTAIFDEDHHNMVIVKDIDMYSLCEHHMLPFFGKVHVAYIPAGRILGLSKLPRIVDVFARRLQVQERLTDQIAEAIQSSLQPEGVAVVIEAYHLCMMMRGVEKQNSKTITSAMRGVFLSDLKTREEFLRLSSINGIMG
jgi:GTP cyclohydrolase IA